MSVQLRSPVTMHQHVLHVSGLKLWPALYTTPLWRQSEGKNIIRHYNFFVLNVWSFSLRRKRKWYTSINYKRRIIIYLRNKIFPSIGRCHQPDIYRYCSCLPCQIHHHSYNLLPDIHNLWKSTQRLTEVFVFCLILRYQWVCLRFWQFLLIINFEKVLLLTQINFFKRK